MLINIADSITNLIFGERFLSSKDRIALSNLFLFFLVQCSVVYQFLGECQPWRPVSVIELDVPKISLPQRKVMMPRLICASQLDIRKEKAARFANIDEVKNAVN